MRTFKNLTENVQEAITMPYGTDFNRPANPEEGMVRYNTTQDALEFYNGTSWNILGDSQISAIYTHDNLVAFYDASNADTTGDTSDQYYSDVELLLHMNGTDGSTTFTDSSSAAHTASNTNTEISTDQFKFGGSSAYFDGTAYLSYSDSNLWNFGSDEFTLEAWVKTSGSATNYSTLLSQTNINAASNSSFYWGIEDTTTGGRLWFGVSTVGSGSPAGWDTYLNGSTTITDNDWHHVSVVRESNTLKLFVDGTLDSSTSFSGTIYNSTRNLYVGAQDALNSPSRLTGYLDELRVTKGVARYTADFTPQTREFYPGTGVEDITSNNNDSLLDGPSLVTTQPKHYSFDGANDFIKTLSNASTFETQTGTAIVWAYKSDWNSIVGSFDILVGNQRAGGSNGGWVIGRNGSNLIFEIRDGSSWKTISYALSNISSGWHQFAGIWNGSNIKLYVDANQESSDSYGGTITYQNWPVHIGVYYNNTGWYNGDLAIFKFYDSALSEADITSEFNYHKSTFGL